MIILALDALDYNLVVHYKCRYLKQTVRGQIDVSDFALLRTVALWASFLSGNHIDEEVPYDKEAQWMFTLDPEQTFLPFFETYKAIDVPAYSFKQRNHLEERSLMRKYFREEASVDEFDAVVWRNHDENKKDFFHALNHHDLVMGYFDLADAIGHLSFGVAKKMKQVYLELDALAKEVNSSFDDLILIASDHGMSAAGRYGEHRRYGFYSINWKLRMRLPKITAFYPLIKKVAKRGFTPF